MTPQERTDDMVRRYGETVSQVQAGRILNRDPKTIRGMITDGRLDAACEGTRVDVYSIARYICAPKVEDFAARIRRTGKTPSPWAV